MFAGAATTHKQREDELKLILDKKLSPPRRTLTVRKQIGVPRKRQQSPLQKKLQKEKRKQARLFYAENGLTSRGFVRKYTPVIFSDLPSANRFEQHPFFHNIPYAVVRGNVQTQLLDELRTIEKEVHRIGSTTSSKPATHRYGANEGYSLGLSVAPGYPHGDKAKGISGSVQWADFTKSRPELRNALVNCLSRILHHTYGHEPWFKRMLHLTTKLNSDTGETRTIPSMPISGIWLTQKPNPKGTHCDRNVVGVSFILATSTAKGSVLVLHSLTGKLIKHKLTQGHILAGSWANHAHCNVKVDESEFRTSLTMYLDMRVFCSRYIYVKPKGFVE